MTQEHESQSNRPPEPKSGIGPVTDPAPTERTRFLVRMLEDLPSRRQISQRAIAITQQHRGATDRTWARIQHWLSSDR